MNMRCLIHQQKKIIPTIIEQISMYKNLSFISSQISNIIKENAETIDIIFEIMPIIAALCKLFK